MRLLRPQQFGGTSEAVHNYYSLLTSWHRHDRVRPREASAINSGADTSPTVCTKLVHTPEAWVQHVMVSHCSGRLSLIDNVMHRADFVYSEYLISGQAGCSGYRAMIYQIAEDYACADLILRLPGHAPMPAFQEVEDVPLVVRHARRSRAQVTPNFCPDCIHPG